MDAKPFTSEEADRCKKLALKIHESMLDECERPDICISALSVVVSTVLEIYTEDHRAAIKAFCDALIQGFGSRREGGPASDG